MCIYTQVTSGISNSFKTNLKCITWNNLKHKYDATSIYDNYDVKFIFFVNFFLPRMTFINFVIFN